MFRLVQKPLVTAGAVVVVLAMALTVWVGWFRADGPSASPVSPSSTAPSWEVDPPSPDEAAGPAVRSYYERLAEAEGQAENPSTAASTPASTTTPSQTPTDYLLAAMAAGDPKWVGVMTESGTEAQIDTFAANAGRQPDLVQIAAGWETDRFQQSILDRIADRGAILMLSWEPWNYRQLAQPQEQPKFALRNILAGDFDEYIDEWAQGIAADGRPMLLRFAHEMNGNWYPWAEGVNGNEPGSYVATWYYVQQRFAGAGADNVLWVWSPNVTYPGSDPVSSFFPGEGAVDLLGLVGYFGHFNRVPDEFPVFDELYGSTIQAMQVLKNQPVLITEASSTEVGGYKAGWTTDFLAEVARRDDVSGFVWFDVVKEADWRINSSQAALDAFLAGLSDPAYN